MNRKIHTITFLLFSAVALFLWASNNNDILKKEQPLTKEKSLVIFVNFGNGYIDFSETTSRNIFVGEFEYEQERPEIQYEIVGDEGRLDIYFSGKLTKEDEESHSHHISSLNQLYDNELHLNLSNKIPIDLKMELGLIKGRLDLGGLKIRNLKMEAGVSTADLLFDKPNPVSLENCTIEGGVGKLMVEKLGNANIRNLSFEGGVGSYVLDFGGEYKQDMYAKLELGAGKIKLYLPEYIGTRIEVEKSFFSSFSIDEVYKKDDVYYNDNWDKTSHKLDLKVETGVGKIDVIWVDE